ncbi:hypothetical protein SNE40_017184 [Patella caerulea]|uniref:Uncharacterized protein n=1 Tax=Patella caerulea TaxID=87958 RepID=A0AAN8JDD0_PATCE
MEVAQYFMLGIILMLNIQIIVHTHLVCTDNSLLHNATIDQMLPNHKIQSFTAPGLMICARECVYQTNCLSFNFDIESGQCELTRVVAGPSIPLVSKTGYVYAVKSDWVTTIAEKCTHVNCAPNHICVPSKTGDMCVLNDCGIPPVVEFGSSPEYRGTVFGYKATYNCSGIGVKAEIVTFICSDKGIWEGQHCRRVSSCKDIQDCDSSYVDGEYWIYPNAFGNDERVKVYCHGLTTDSPTDYITLPKENRILWPPMKAIGYDCDLVTTDRTDSGESVFDTIRITTSNMAINQSDYQFARLLSGINHEYGNARDCSNSNGICGHVVMGYAKIDTGQTGLIINRTAVWRNNGHTFGMKYFNRSSDHVIEAVCGGWCGGCYAETPLTLELDNSTILPDGSATGVTCRFNYSSGYM